MALPLSKAEFDESFPPSFVVGNDRRTVTFIKLAMRNPTYTVHCFSTSVEFLEQYDDTGLSPRCLILESTLPQRSGLSLYHELGRKGAILPVIFLTAGGNIPLAVEAIRSGAIDFLEKPIPQSKLMETVNLALTIDEGRRLVRHRQAQMKEKMALLSRRERDVFNLLRQCKSNKQVAAILDIGFQTAAKHRSNIFRKLGVQTELEFMKEIEYRDACITVENQTNGDSDRFVAAQFL